MSDVFAVLGADHQEVKGLLSRLESGPDDAGQLAESLVIEESKHEAAEEMYFWPAVRDKVPDGEALAERGLRQEQEGKEVLDRLRKSGDGDDDFRRLVSEFASAGRAHIAFEEEQVWPALRAVLSSAEAEELGEKLKAAKDSGPTRPHPHGPDSASGLKTVGTAAAMADKARDAATGRGQ